MENRKRFVEGLSMLLILYSEEKVRRLEYVRKDTEELVRIIYTNGYEKYVNISGDSYIAIMNDIYKAMR